MKLRVGSENYKDMADRYGGVKIIVFGAYSLKVAVPREKRSEWDFVGNEDDTILWT